MSDSEPARVIPVIYRDLWVRLVAEVKRMRDDQPIRAITARSMDEVQRAQGAYMAFDNVIAAIRSLEEEKEVAASAEID